MSSARGSRNQLSGSQVANESAWVLMPSLSLRPPGLEDEENDDGTMRLVIEESKDEQGQLNLLVNKAKTLKHPGVLASGLLLC